MTSRPVTIYQLRIVIADITPPIWRLVEVPGDFAVDWLHDVIQWAMDWESEHPYRFYAGEFAYLEDPTVHEQELGKELDATHHTLAKVYGNHRRYLRYVCDLGADSWWHHVWLEDTFPAAMEVKYPRLVDGERASPPDGFDGTRDYADYLRGRLDDDDPRLEQFADFDPGAFDATPRPFPNARTYREGQQQKPPERPVAFQPRAAESYGPMYNRVESMLEAAADIDADFRADLRRALEDLTLVEDALPPKTADTLRTARSHKLGIDKFLIDCLRNHRQLADHYSTAPLHAAHLLSFWRVDGATDHLVDVLREAPDDAAGLVDTLVRALAESGPSGTEQLLEHLDDFSWPRRAIVVDKLVRLGVRDDRLLDALRSAMKDAGPERANVPYLLSQYDDERATGLLFDALDDEIAALVDRPDAPDDERARRTDYALFLTEMLAEAGETLDDDRWQTLEKLEDFYWPSQAFKSRLRRGSGA